jgi:hypothetical protein
MHGNTQLKLYGDYLIWDRVSVVQWLTTLVSKKYIVFIFMVLGKKASSSETLATT